MTTPAPDRTATEYAAALRRAVDAHGSLRADYVSGLGRSATAVLRAAMIRARSPKEWLDALPNWKGKRRKKAPAPDAEAIATLTDNAERLPEVQRALIFVPYYMGFRASEFLGLSRPRIESALKHGEITFTRKGGKSATLPVNKDVKALFRIMLNADTRWTRIGELLSSGTHKAQMTAFERLVKKTGRPLKPIEGETYFDWHPHALRHAFARYMRKHGASIKAIQAWLGHENVATTDIYLGSADPSEGVDFVPGAE